jgi:hypothetical protein
MQRILNPIYCHRSDCRIRGCIYFSKAISRYYVAYFQCLMAPQRDMNAHQKRDRIYRISQDFAYLVES